MTPEEKGNFDFRLQELEKKLLPMFDSLKNRIYSYDRLSEENKEIKKSLDSLISQQAMIEGKLNGFVELHSSLKTKVEQDINSLIIRSESHVGDILDLKKKHSYHEKTLSNAMELNEDNIEKIIDETLKKIETKVGKFELDESNKGFSELIRHLDIDSSMIKKDLESFKQKVASALNMLSSISVSPTTHEKDISSIENSLNELNVKQDELRQNTSNAINNQAVIYKNNLDSLRKEMLSKPNATEDVRSEMIKKLENVSLDAKNATLRTQNSDQKILNLEKKIENFNLLMKKYELDK